MNLTPIYELKSRLRAAAIAGTNLLSEDFRLKKAVEGFAPLEKASPVFAKIGEMTNALLADNSPANLLDTITLVDAVITTLGTVETKSEISDLETIGGGEILEIPYSRLSVAINSLTAKGSGKFNTFNDIRENNPELLRDYRVYPALAAGLGASYTELADAVFEVVSEMGSGMIPFLKRGFDPKGKKEMVQRVRAIENIAGAAENEFYLEQLEESEKDVRKALIYALRHDDSNAEKLIDLIKTEKNKAKEAALSALISLECEKAVEFVTEYSEKKPAEVICALARVSSKWTGELAARLINELLVDKNGNKITLSEAADVDKVKLKKSDFWALEASLWGKWGADIEKIYREFYCEERMPALDRKLKTSILVTDDEGMKSLALELNSSPKTKDCYVCSEAVIRLLSEEDSSEWFTERIKAGYNELAKNKDAGIITVLRTIYLSDGKYYLMNRCYDPISDGWVMNDPREVIHSIKGAISDAMMSCPCWGYDFILEGWIDESDREYCAKVGDYFLRRLTAIKPEKVYTDEENWCAALKKCGFYNVENLAVNYLKNFMDKGFMSNIETVIQDMPGDDDYRIEQARMVLELAQKEKPSWFDVDKFKEWIALRYGHWFVGG